MAEARAKSASTPDADYIAEIRGAWEALGEDSGVVEQAIDLEREISVLVARSPSGEVKVYPAAWNHHEHQILAWSVIPAPIPAALEAQARKIAEEIADTFQLEGILAIEFFVTPRSYRFRRSLRQAPRQRTRPPPTQQLSRQRASLCHWPVRATRPRHLRTFPLVMSTSSNPLPSPISSAISGTTRPKTKPIRQGTKLRRCS